MASSSTRSSGRTVLGSVRSTLRIHSSVQSGSLALLPLRAFLGATFLYAGVSKLLDRHYLDATSPLSVHAQMLSAAVRSPIGDLVSFTAQHASVTGLAIALGEAAVGLGVLLGLFTRLAAFGGFLLALSFFLTVSWTTRPYYYGPDIAYAAAWTPLLIAGDAGLYSLTGRLRTAARRRLDPRATRRLEEEATLQQEVERRTLLQGGLVAAAIGGVSVTAGTALALLRRPSGAPESRNQLAPGSATPGAAVIPGSPSAGAVIAVAASVAVGSSRKFTAPNGAPAFLVHPTADTFLAFNAACTHQGCPVSYTGSGFSCPCHGSTFAQNGQVTSGPANAPLTKIPVAVVDGNVTTT